MSRVMAECLLMINHMGGVSTDKHARRGLHFTEATVKALARRRLLETEEQSRGYWGDGSIRTVVSWVLTEAGRAALEGSKP